MLFIYFRATTCVTVIYCFYLVQWKVECGRVKRIVGGTEVECDTLPRVASLRKSSDHQHLCGATILSPGFAVTAAHCVPYHEQQYLLQLNNVCVHEGEPLPKANVSEIIVHEQYDKYTRAHDIALLRIKLDTINEHFLSKSILPNSSFGLSGECTVAGYGVKNLTSMEVSEKLLAAKMLLISLDECTQRLGPFLAPHCDSGMMCAMADGVDSCQGDSGGPLICGEGVIEGVSSHGLSYGVPEAPAVFTSIGAHRRWIKLITNL